MSQSAKTVELIKPEKFEAIEFSKFIPIANEKLWQENLSRVRWIMDRCKVEEVVSNYYAKNIPIIYSYGEIKVTFMPHFSYYKVGDIRLKLPQSEEQLHSDLETINKLESFKAETMKALVDRIK